MTVPTSNAGRRASATACVRCMHGLAVAAGVLAALGFARADDPAVAPSPGAGTATMTASLADAQGRGLAGTVHVRARYARRDGWSGATVLDLEATADAAGRLAVELPPGQAALRIDVPGFLPVERGATEIAASRTLALERLVFERGASIAGRVLDTSGAPIPDARVTVFDRGRRAIALTDPAGRFSLPGFAADRACEAGAERSGFAPGGLVTVRPGREDVVITLAREARIDARVLVGDPPRPVAAVTIETARLDRGGELELAGAPAWRAITADGDGNVALDHVAPGRYALRVLVRGAVPHRVTELEIAPGARVDLGTLRMEPGARLEGVVRDARDGRPVAGAEVGCEAHSLHARIDPATSVTSDALGRFALEGLAPGPQRVVARAPCFVDRVESVDLAPGLAAALDVDLAAAGGLAGRAAAEDGSPRAGWGVIVTGPRLASRPRAATVGDDGAFRVDDLAPGTYRVLLVPPDAQFASDAASRTVTVHAGETAAVDWSRPEGIAIAGSLHRGGRPVPAALLWSAAGAAHGPGEAVTAFAGAGGAFDVRLAPGRYDVAVAPLGEGDDRADGLLARCRVVVDERTTRLDLDVPEAALAGEVADASNGRPVAGASVTALAHGEMPGPLATATSTDALGRFELGALTADSGDLLVRAPGFAARRVENVRPGRRPVRVTLVPEVPVTVRVVDREGEPVAGAAVMVLGAMAGALPPVFTDARGVVEVPGLAPGEAEIGAIARGLAPATRRVDAGADGAFDLVLVDGGTLDVAVRGPERPLGGRVVDVRDADGVDLGPLLRLRALCDAEEFATDAEGRLAIGPLAPGAYTLAASDASIEVTLGAARREATIVVR